MKFKTRMINAAVAAALGTVAGAAQAVNLGNDGEGQVLIYPYYTVQTKAILGGTGQFNTLITVVNSDSTHGKAVKVRFLEGKASHEVLDFNLYLSPNDMWTGALTTCSTPSTINGCTVAGAPMLRTTDNSCTAPEIPAVTGASNVTTSGVMREVAFVNYNYSGTNTDAWSDQSLDRAKEGYVEIIEMADLNSTTKTYTWSLHSQSTQVPANCVAIRNGWLPTAGPTYYTDETIDMAVPTGHLSGALTIINAPEGTDMSSDAVALDNFSNVRNHRAPGTIDPTLGTVTPKISAVFDGANLVETCWDCGPSTLAPVAPVSAVLDRNQVINEYVVLASPVAFSTDHVLTLPTKRLHLLNTTDMHPFTTTVSQNAAGVCEPVTITFYNRDETIQSSAPGFSPPPPSQTNQLCYEANVLSIANGTTVSNVLGSTTVHLSPITSIFSEGWVRYGFTQTMTAPSGQSFAVSLGTGSFAFSGMDTTYVGMPVVGFAAQLFSNVAQPLLSYGTAYTHRYTRSIALSGGGTFASPSKMKR